MADDMAAMATIERGLAAIAKSLTGRRPGTRRRSTRLPTPGQGRLPGIKHQVKDDADEAKLLTVDLVARTLEVVPTSSNTRRRDRA